METGNWKLKITFMLNINDLKPGVRAIFNEQPHVVVSAEHSKQGRAGGILRSKLKNLITGAQFEHTFAGAEKLEEAELETRKAQFLYCDDPTTAGGNAYFMNPADFEQFEIALTKISDVKKFLKEGEEVELLYFEGNPINIQLPIKMKFRITYTEPGFKGNTTSNVLKPATIETGAEIKVPIFVKVGDEIIIDTRTGEYVERA